MALMPIRRFGDPVLREPGATVERFDDALRRLAEDMFETMYDAPGVGLAAQQVGLAIRLFVFDAGEDRGKGVVANPVLCDPDGEEEDDEGCLSVPGLYYPTTRANRVRVVGQDLDGVAVSLEGEGLLARIFQHETDHVNGVLYLDRLRAGDRRRALAELRDRELGDPDGRRSGR
jgi:peptide deformylase